MGAAEKKFRRRVLRAASLALVLLLAGAAVVFHYNVTVGASTELRVQAVSIATHGVLAAVLVGIFVFYAGRLRREREREDEERRKAEVEIRQGRAFLQAVVDAMPDAVIIKVGSMDDPSQYPGPQVAIFCMDKQSFHTVPEGVPEFERVPG